MYLINVCFVTQLPCLDTSLSAAEDVWLVVIQMCNEWNERILFQETMRFWLAHEMSIGDFSSIIAWPVM